MGNRFGYQLREQAHARDSTIWEPVDGVLG